MFPEPNILKDRALMLSKVRSFFEKQNILEIDCPQLLKIAPHDLNIEAIKTDSGILHISPEYMLKKLLSSFDSLYFLGHVFRKGEIGKYHSEEFTMIEWYRNKTTFSLFFNEVLSLIELFLGKQKLKKISYFEAFQKWAQVDFKTISDEEQNLLMIEKIEPNLQGLTLIYHFPLSQSLFAKAINDFESSRFELYYNSIELANGCEELTDSKEQQRRLEKCRAPLDSLFLESIAKLSSCFGIAIGFDRLLMLKHKKNSLKEISIIL